MKIPLFLRALPLVAGLVWLPVHAGNFGVYAQSPDHPATWVVGAHNIHQDLRWDARRQMVVADVKYNTRDYADDTNPPREDDYTLAFPTVRLDAATGCFLADGVPVATLRHGLFGSDVVLNRHVALSINRHHGLITAAIVPAEDE